MNIETLFKDWNTFKQKLHSLPSFPHPKEGEIWWCSVGVNIGQEIFGKGSFFTRPIFVLTVKETGEFIGLPMSSKIKQKKFSKIIETEDGKQHVLKLLKIRNYDNRRLRTKLYKVPKDVLSEIKEDVRRII